MRHNHPDSRKVYIYKFLPDFSPLRLAKRAERIERMIQLEMKKSQNIVELLSN